MTGPREPSQLTVQCASATITANSATSKALDAVYAAEYALDQVAKVERELAAAREQLSKAILELRAAHGHLNRMAEDYTQRLLATMPKAE